jgi:glycosyltransferase involved in cell wall biosynthesis
MRVVQIHNNYRFKGGENVVYESTAGLLKRRGVAVDLLTRNSHDVERSLYRKVRAFISGIYSLSAAREMARIISDETPDVVHIHNVYPLISPSILLTCREAGVPVVMTCHNYRLICPIGVHFHKGKVCEECSGGREYFCALRNCRDNIYESVAYAIRNISARRFRLFADSISIYISISEFLKQRMIASGFEKTVIAVIPNRVPIPEKNVDPQTGDYVAYAGRISEEKGISILLDVFRRLPHIPVRLAGEGPLMPNILRNAPRNAAFIGSLNHDEMPAFYRKARMLVVPSVWFETFGLVAAEAMGYGLPVIASRIGGLPEIVDDGVTGLLFEPGNVEDLTSKIKMLWETPDLCRQMGQAGREKVMREYNDDVYYKRLVAVYERAIEINRQNLDHGK